MRETQDDRHVVTNLFAAFPNNVASKCRARDQIAAIFIFARVHHIPKEFIDQVTMRAMNLDRIEAEFLGFTCCVCVSHDHVGDFAFGRFGLDLFAGMSAPGRAIGNGVWIGAGTWLAHHANMPELRRDFTGCLVHGFDHIAPSRKGIILVEIRDARIV